MIIESIPWVLVTLNILLNGLVLALLHEQKSCAACAVAFMMFSIDLNILVWNLSLTHALAVSFMLALITLTSSLIVPFYRLNYFSKGNDNENNFIR